MAEEMSAEEQARIEQILDDQGRFDKLMLEPDDFRAVILGHTYIETVMKRLWSRKLHLKNVIGATPFSASLNMAAALGEIRLEYVEPHKALFKIRNELAHKLEGSITPKLIKALKDSVKGDADLWLGDSQNMRTYLHHTNAVDNLGISEDGLYIRYIMIMLYLSLMLRYRSNPTNFPDIPLTPSEYAAVLLASENSNERFDLYDNEYFEEINETGGFAEDDPL